MRQWQRQWRGWLEHRPGPGLGAKSAIRYRARVPGNGLLRFGLGGPHVQRKRPGGGGLGSGQKEAGGVRYSILAEDGEGKKQQLFSAIHNPGQKPAHRRSRQFEVDLRAYSEREVTLYFQAERLGKPSERSGWIEPILVRSAGDERQAGALESDEASPAEAE